MAATKSNVNVKIDTEVKELASQFLARMGIDQTTAIDMFFRQIITERRLPFQPTVMPTPDEQLIAALEKINPEAIELPVDDGGNIIIDKEKYPELYD